MQRQEKISILDFIKLTRNQLCSLLTLTFSLVLHMKVITMIGHGVYFARSREGTERKANRKGAFICAEVEMGRVLRLNPDERNLYRGKKDWWSTHDTSYFCNSDPRLDEFCVKSPSQILRWIMVIENGFDSKVFSYGLDREFDDTRCLCI